jgi:hemolysin III
VLLWIVWSGACSHSTRASNPANAPRWLYVPIYLALGWIAVAFMPQFWSSGPEGPAVVWFLAAGGAAYTLGAVVYALKRPNPSPRWFGFHEVFHALTVIGFGCTYVSVSLATYALR